jgi:hypothetical protein
MYLADSGLWTACHESRDAMERRFRMAEWRPKVTEFRRGARTWGLGRTAPATTVFLDKNEQIRQLVFYPNADLIILQPFDYETLDWDGFLYDIPFFNPDWGYHPRNIAFEFDPEWDFNYPLRHESPYSESPSLNSVFKFLLRYRCRDINIWFIDYRLRRRPGSTSTDRFTKRRQVFHASNRHFIEVCDNMEWMSEKDSEWTIDWDTGEIKGRHKTALSFLRYMMKTLSLCIKILACEVVR